ncbi:hypothetical protein MFU01_57520 [Myxococcus fulvus]|uniref:Uncharacterized protein n=1 Tax=Myxococcus fulvus TaxID=33 RepID=A0A511T962_MYXFU|nr:hypothetical protein MFU01_57520 [Myxococcus fulvus]
MDRRGVTRVLAGSGRWAGVRRSTDRLGGAQDAALMRQAFGSERLVRGVWWSIDRRAVEHGHER